MGIEGQGFENTPLGKHVSDQEAATAITETEIQGEKIKVFPKPDGSFTVYVDNCIFTVEVTDDTLTASNDTPSKNHGAWRASSLQPLATQAVQENYFGT